MREQRFMQRSCVSSVMMACLFINSSVFSCCGIKKCHEVYEAFGLDFVVLLYVRPQKRSLIVYWQQSSKVVQGQCWRLFKWAWWLGFLPHHCKILFLFFPQCVSVYYFWYLVIVVMLTFFFLFFFFDTLTYRKEIMKMGLTVWSKNSSPVKTLSTVSNTSAKVLDAVYCVIRTKCLVQDKSCEVECCCSVQPWVLWIVHSGKKKFVLICVELQMTCLLFWSTLSIFFSLQQYIVMFIDILSHCDGLLVGFVPSRDAWHGETEHVAVWWTMSAGVCQSCASGHEGTMKLQALLTCGLKGSLGMYQGAW
jgi:hypothetical protein